LLVAGHIKEEGEYRLEIAFVYVCKQKRVEYERLHPVMQPQTFRLNILHIDAQLREIFDAHFNVFNLSSKQIEKIDQKLIRAQKRIGWGRNLTELTFKATTLSVQPHTISGIATAFRFDLCVD